ncbi:MAG: hypothetical protein KAT05_11895, partial [Spirochaetes bacterium]|nr:hypothetical protein [Spirochaetota bacterium]
MYQKFLLIILLSVCFSAFIIDQTLAQTPETKSNSKNNDTLKTTIKDFYITPYVGSSTLVGNLGIEFQYNNFGYN